MEWVYRKDQHELHDPERRLYAQILSDHDQFRWQIYQYRKFPVSQIASGTRQTIEEAKSAALEEVKKHESRSDQACLAAGAEG